MSYQKKLNDLLYDEFFLEKTFNSPKLIADARSEIQNLLKILNLEKEAHVIDVACGSGRHLMALHDAGIDSTGVDVSNACISLAIKNCPNLEKQIFNDDFLNFSINNQKKYDLAISMGAGLGYGESEEENENFLKSIFRVLKDDGIMVIQFLNKNWNFDKYEKKTTFWHEDENYYILESRHFLNFQLSSEKIFISKLDKTERKYSDKITTFHSEEIINLFKILGLKVEKIALYSSLLQENTAQQVTQFPVLILRKS